MMIDRQDRATTSRAFAVGLALIFMGVSGLKAEAADKPPRYVEPDVSGKLVYASDVRGNRVPDFSYCGYRGGGVAIPDAPVHAVVAPAQGDNGPTIQAAIDQVARRKPDARGIRGAVLLLAGRHEVSGRLRIDTSGVILRGQGDGAGGTSLVARGTDRRPLITIGGRGERLAPSKSAILIMNEFVPVGTRRVKLERADTLSVGDRVVIEHPSTSGWIASLGMDRFPPADKGFWLDWQPGKMDVRSERVITAIDGTTVTIDIPLTFAIDAALGRGRLVLVSNSGRLGEVGAENLRCESDYDRANPLDEQHAWDAIALEGVENSWVRQVTVKHFAGSAVRVGDDCKGVTVEDCASLEPVSEIGGYRRHTFWTSGQMTLFQRCRTEQGGHDFAVGALAAGPNAFVNCEATAAYSFSGPVESWATGVLYDNITLDGGGLSLTNRESEGQGVGWAAANSVLWQCTAPLITCRNPPGAQNWAIGCWGQFLGDGNWQAANEFVKPLSLYRAQLAERLGDVAVENLQRRTIPIQPGATATVERPETSSATTVRSDRPISLRNGWLVENERLFIGHRLGTVWWRGSVLPERAAGFGVGVTRFVPGRSGPGFTDNLDALTDDMRASGRTALEHHWGLWYDRRRDDHQMVRRTEGDVWPPFYEQPWARSGRGHAWDGLSKYDLTAFNPWYFVRLDEFAGHCDRKGLLLLHEAYFQHNILEAGAHWTDFPWRPANCLQDTGFAEPPPYVNKKRIFMAEDFYDVSHPTRRELHRLYIRKGLDTLGAHPNVIFLTGEEYTGPVEFVQFWLDAVTDWEKETGKDVLIGLSATKDVQDAILADPSRRAAISVIEMKYWWYTPNGTTYAPEGGKNLAPRQQIREWKGAKGRSAEQTARQLREYRDRFPDKAILCAHDGADPWAVVAAGGSMPSLPASTEPRLLSALPRMKPTGAGERQWALADPGRDYLTLSLSGEAIRVDLTSLDSTFKAMRIDPKTGQATESRSGIRGGKIWESPVSESGPSLLWLTRDEAGDRPEELRR